MKNSIPKLLYTIRPTLEEIAEWVGRSRPLVCVWRDGTYQPTDPYRARLVKAVRKHAALLLTLADNIEREGRKRT